MIVIEAVFYTLLILLIMIVIMILLLTFFMRRANRKVINAFREYGALKEENAKSREELGIVGQSFLERMVKPKDYRVKALEFLLNIGVVKETKKEKLYLSEEFLKDLKDRKNREKNKLEMWKFILPPDI